MAKRKKQSKRPQAQHMPASRVRKCPDSSSNRNKSGDLHPPLALSPRHCSHRPWDNPDRRPSDAGRLRIFDNTPKLFFRLLEDTGFVECLNRVFRILVVTRIEVRCRLSRFSIGFVAQDNRERQVI